LVVDPPFDSILTLPPRGVSVDELSPSVTAVAVSALVVAEQQALQLETCDEQLQLTLAYQGDLSELLVSSLKRLAASQNADGGWGPRLAEPSRIEDSLSVLAAFQLTGVPAATCRGDVGTKLKEFICSRGGLATLCKFGESPTCEQWALLAHLALADLVRWRDVPRVVETSDSMAAEGRKASSGRALELAIGLARHHRAPTRNPWRRRTRQRLASDMLDDLARLQASDGSFFGDVRLTSYVVLMLGGARLANHRTTRAAVEFLFEAVHTTGMWPDVHHAPPLKRTAK
jgi:hypothetical protein